MKAVVKYGEVDGAVELRDVPVPTIGPSDVLLEVRAAGVCGSDIEMFRHRVSFKVNVPVIQGHEFCGVIVEKGAEVKGYEVGDAVVSETAAHICGICPLCRAGEYNLCPDRLGFGYGTNGAFTKYVRVPQRCLHSLPPGRSFGEFSLTEPMCVGYNAVVEKSRVRPGDAVVIFGPGPIGLCCLQVAKLMGAGPIVLIGATGDDTRLELGKQLGADIVLNGVHQDPIPVVRELTDGLGAPLVVDAAGPSATLRMSIELVRRNGQITKVGWGPGPVGFSLDGLISKAAALQGSFSHTWKTWEAVLKLIGEGGLRTEPLISATLPITEYRRAYELVESRQAVKVVLEPVD